MKRNDISEIGSFTNPREIWNLDTEWREINFLFYIFNKIFKFSFLTSESGTSISSYEKQTAVNLLTEKLANGDETTINKINNAIKSNIEIRHMTSVAQAKSFLKKYFHENNVSQGDMEWIKKGDSLLVEYLWGYIHLATTTHNEAFPVIPKFYQICNDERKDYEQQKTQRVISDEVWLGDDGIKTNFKQNQRRMVVIENKTDPIYKQIRLDLNPGSEEQKKKSIITFFDMAGRNREEKLDHLNYIREKWNTIKNGNRLLDWLNENDDLLEWALKYIKSNFFNGRLPRWIIYLDNFDENKTEKEIKLTLSTIYSLIDSIEARDLFIKLLARAGVQYRHKLKAKTENKRNINIFISEADKDDFDRIKKHNKLTAEKTLSLLIDFYIKKRA